MEIAPKVYSIREQAGSRSYLSGHVHAFLIDDGPATGLTLVDTLYGTDARPVLEQIRRIGRTTTDLKTILLTHAHRSHLGGLALLRNLSGATVCAHAWEADIVAGERKAQAVPIKPMRPLKAYPLQMGLALGLGRHPPCPVNRTIKDGDEVGPLRVVYTPGHSPGHLAFYLPGPRLLFAGDAVATWPEFDAGWPSFTLNREQHGASLRRMARLEPQVIAVGHGEPITGGAAERLRSLAEGYDG